jgi:hypothetical protein
MKKILSILVLILIIISINGCQKETAPRVFVNDSNFINQPDVYNNDGSEKELAIDFIMLYPISFNRRAFALLFFI